jgi:hypothetical protein
MPDAQLADRKEVRHDTETSLVVHHAGAPRGRGPACIAASAADKTKVDGATKQVEKGAKQIGQGQVGPGFKEMFTGVGHTVVEGAKFSGENVKELFSGKK